MSSRTVRQPICSRCVIDASVPGVSFDSDGVCSHCHIHTRLNAYYPTGPSGEEFLEKTAAAMRLRRSPGGFDCVVGFSGGRDSTYALFRTVQLGLRPLAVHFDNGWDSAVAKANIQNACQRLGVELHSVIADWDESRELTNCTLRASVPYIDLTDDVGIAGALYRTAAAENIRWIVYAHSFRTEGINPLKWNYVDGRYVRQLIRRFARKPLTHFKNVDIHHLIYWIVVKRIRILTIANYYDDADPAIEGVLQEQLGWKSPGGWHFDNEIFGLQCHYARHKFGIDWRVIELAAIVREGHLSREAALSQLDEVPEIERPEVVDYARRKQGLSEADWSDILAAPPRFFDDFPTYYPWLRLFRLPIRWMCRLDVVLPPHVYEKYFAV